MLAQNLQFVLEHKVAGRGRVRWGGGKKLGKSGDDGIQSELGKLGSAWSDQAFPLHRPGMHSFLERSSICAIFWGPLSYKTENRFTLHISWFLTIIVKGSVGIDPSPTKMSWPMIIDFFYKPTFKLFSKKVIALWQAVTDRAPVQTSTASAIKG